MEFCSRHGSFESLKLNHSTCTLQPPYNTVHYNTGFDITRCKDGSQKCIVPGQNANGCLVLRLHAALSRFIACGGASTGLCLPLGTNLVVRSPSSVTSRGQDHSLVMVLK